MNITGKLSLGFGVVILVGLPAAFLGQRASDTTHEKFEYVQKGVFPAFAALEDVRFYGLRLIDTTRELTIYNLINNAGAGHNPGIAANLDELQNEAILPFEQAMQHYTALVHQHFPHETEVHLNDLHSQAERLKQISIEALNKISADQQRNEAVLLRINSQLASAEDIFASTIDKIISHEISELDVLEEEIHVTNLWTIYSAITAFILALLTGYFYARTFTRPVTALVTAAEKIAQGDLRARVDIKSKDEIGKLGQAFNKMMESLNYTTLTHDYIDNILSTIGDGLIVLDKQHNIIRVNTALLNMLHFQHDDLINQSIEKILEDPWAISSQENGQDHNKTVLLTKEGDVVPVNISCKPLLDDHNNPIGKVILAQDISDLLKTQDALLTKADELTHTNKELNEFAYIVSHDLKAPLRAIANLSQWIEEDLQGKLTEDSRKQIDMLRNRVVRMENLINGILEYSRIGRTAVNLEMVDTKALLGEILEGMAIPTGFSINIGPGMPRFMTARVRLSQVFANLISNAIKYNNQAHGRIDITMHDQGDYYEFAVADNGPGIAPEYHEKVFVIFQTLMPRDKVESTGIGLTLVKKIVENYGGTIRLESQEGQGVTFRFTWPKHITERKAA